MICIKFAWIQQSIIPIFDEKKKLRRKTIHISEDGGSPFID